MTSLTVINSIDTAALLDMHQLVDAIEVASQELEAGLIHVPLRAVMPLRHNGLLLSMPATSDDIAIHKLVSVCPRNRTLGAPTIAGAVTVCNTETGEPTFILDGPVLTGRRTAALSMLGVRLLFVGEPKAFLVIGTGSQAKYHIEAISTLYPESRILVQGLSRESERAFCVHLAGSGVTARQFENCFLDEIDVVLTVTTSKTPVYGQKAQIGRLVIGAGNGNPNYAELAPETINGSQIVVDDFDGARSEAGDLLQAGVDWSNVTPIGMLRQGQSQISRPVVFKSVGCAAWDLAACRVARIALQTRFDAS